MPEDQMTTAAPRHRRAFGSALPPMLAPLDRFGPAVGVSLAGIAVVLLFGLVVARTSWWSALELPVDGFLGAHHLAVLNVLALGIAWLFAPVQAIALTAVACIAVFARTRNGWVTGTFAGLVVGGGLGCELIKRVVQRARPDPALLPDPLAHDPSLTSYPSGHVCFATALAVATVYLLRRSRAQKWLVLASAVCVPVVAVSRLYLGVHYPADTVAAIVFTVCAVTAALACWNRWAVPRLRGALRRGDVAR